MVIRGVLGNSCSYLPADITLRREIICGINFREFREIKSSRKVLRELIRENKSTRIYFFFFLIFRLSELMTLLVQWRKFY